MSKSKIKWIFGVVISMLSMTLFAMDYNNPCVGPGALLSLINRPSLADSACVVPKKQAVLELGAQYQTLLYGGYVRGGYGKNFPQAEFRIGIPKQNEVSIVFPNYFQYTVSPHSGWIASAIKFKHGFNYIPNVVSAIEGILILPTGSASFGSQSTGGAVNGIISYSITEQFSVTGMLGVASLAYPKNSGGQYFTTINPDLLFNWLPRNNLDFFIEFFGQTKTGPAQGAGFNADGGIIYLVSEHMTLDFEVGQRISGLLGGYNHYIGFGGAIAFS